MLQCHTIRNLIDWVTNGSEADRLKAALKNARVRKRELQPLWACMQNPYRGAIWSQAMNPSITKCLLIVLIHYMVLYLAEVQPIWGNGFASHVMPLDALLTALGSIEPQTRAEAARMLGDRHEKGAVAALLARLRDEQEIDTVKKAVLYALGKIGHQQALPALINALQHEESSEVRASAAQALGAFPAARDSEGAGPHQRPEGRRVSCKSIGPRQK